MHKVFKVGARAAVAGLVAGAVLLVASAAPAVLTGRNSTVTGRQFYLHENTPFSTSSVFYVPLPGASQTVVVPFGTRRLLNVRFSAESQCTGTIGWCTARPVLIRPVGPPRELDPIAGPDFAFDSAEPIGPTAQWASHALERTTPWLRGGTYTVVIEVRTVFGATSFRLDDWTLAVEMERP